MMGQAMTPTGHSLPEADAAALAASMAALRSPGGPVVRAADLLGRVLGRAGDAVMRRAGLSGGGNPALQQVAEIALGRAFDIALLGVEDRIGPMPSPPGMAAAAVSGVLGGMAGMAGFLPDAVATTLIIMRDIARIAREEGEDLSTEAARAACVAVFGLRAEDESGYFSARLMLQGQAAQAVLQRVATRWGPVLGEKFALGAVPLAGAVAGSVLNTAFLAHYRRLARAHFTIRRLERQHGRATIRDAAGLSETPPGDAPFVDE